MQKVHHIEKLATPVQYFTHGILLHDINQEGVREQSKGQANFCLTPVPTFPYDTCYALLSMGKEKADMVDYNSREEYLLYAS